MSENLPIQNSKCDIFVSCEEESISEVKNIVEKALDDNYDVCEVLSKQFKKAANVCFRGVILTVGINVGSDLGNQASDDKENRIKKVMEEAFPECTVSIKHDSGSDTYSIKILGFERHKKQILEKYHSPSSYAKSNPSYTRH